MKEYIIHILSTPWTESALPKMSAAWMTSCKYDPKTNPELYDGCRSGDSRRFVVHP